MLSYLHVTLLTILPSSVLHDQIPHSVLLPNQPLFGLPPHVFSCVCFVHILTLGQDKLSAKATKCVFLGYSRLHKGYRCYSPDINCYFISADVTFFEDSFFFSSVARPLMSDVLSIPFVLPSLDFPSPLTNVVNRPLQVYTRPFRPPTRPLIELSSMSPSSLALISKPYDDLPIAIRKGTRCTSNPLHVYNFLSFHHLFYPTLPLSPPYLLSLPLTTLVRLSLIRDGDRKWSRKWMLFTLMTHGSLSLFHLASLLLVFVRSIQ